MKIWTITTSQRDDGTATMVYTSEAEANAHRARIIAASWESWFGEDTPMPDDTNEAWGILTDQVGFLDTVDVTEHEIALPNAVRAHMGQIMAECDCTRPECRAGERCIASDLLDAARYRFLRGRDLDAIHAGGVFAGLTPDNIVLNGDDLDRAVDAAITAIKEFSAVALSAMEGGAA